MLFTCCLKWCWKKTHDMKSSALKRKRHDTVRWPTGCDKPRSRSMTLDHQVSFSIISPWRVCWWPCRSISGTCWRECTRRGRRDCHSRDPRRWRPSAPNGLPPPGKPADPRCRPGNCPRGGALTGSRHTAFGWWSDRRIASYTSKPAAGAPRPGAGSGSTPSLTGETRLI